MRIIEVKPKGRDKTAKMCYLFYDWYFRKNRKIIESETQKAVMDMFLYGRGAEEIKWRRYESKTKHR